ncbi:MAG TPA: N-acetylmuramoyl-L-alanine amidase [Candidatus Cloacimonadota bacterium]|jgi:N-acetylmuramoyl-L-alanine amidase|nr:N-acetylmuramoyl-L-alanine amidase [Candidatus Cloacimonadota bacterium]HQG93368.1 N-acetylmuramoyl-L-alanine amidase [Acidobacteriota bacterium]
MKVCLDAGHGGKDSGAVGQRPFTRQEKDINLKIALLLEEELLAKGCRVLMTRRTDRTLSLLSRAEFANRYRADLFVSIHANASENEAAEGMEVFTFPGSVKGQQIAQAVLRSMLATCPGHKDRGVKEANFAVLRLTAMPAVLVECEFLTNPKQLSFLMDPANQRAIATAIGGGIKSEKYPSA